MNMAIPLSTYTVKALVISTGALSVALLLTVAAPLILDFVVSDVPLIYSIAASLLSPPYLYILINFIIISIAASSKLHTRSFVDDSYSSPSPGNTPADIVGMDYVVVPDGIVLKAPDDPFRKVEEEDGARFFYQMEAEEKEVSRNETVEEDSHGGRPLVAASPRNDSMELSVLNVGENKPLVSSRFYQRKPVKAPLEGGKALRVTSKQKRQDTLESTWKAITEGRSMPLTRHLKKSDTWDVHVVDKDSPPSLPPQRMMKSDTFRDATTKSSPSRSPATGRIRREPSLGQDELNRRVEAFIKKFNEEMRLQRKKSLDQYLQMVHGGAH